MLAHRLIEGVGDGTARVEKSERVLHVKRPLTTVEDRLLPAGWAELEAIDAAGQAGYLDAIAKGMKGAR